MPRYDYRCDSCENEFELVQSFSEAGSGTCPVCSGSGRRVFHAVPVIYKGSGFYTTDYGRPKPPVENKAGSNGDAPSSSTGSSDDAKPDTPAKPAKPASDSAGKSSTGSGSAAASSTPAGSA